MEMAINVRLILSTDSIIRMVMRRVLLKWIELPTHSEIKKIGMVFSGKSRNGKKPE